MLKWIETNVDSEMCIKDRFRGTERNPKAGYRGIKFYED